MRPRSRDERVSPLNDEHDGLNEADDAFLARMTERRFELMRELEVAQDRLRHAPTDKARQAHGARVDELAREFEVVWDLERDARYRTATIDTIDHLGGHERIPKIVEWWQAGQLTGQELNQFIAAHWNAFERPITLMSVRKWVALFTDAGGFITDTPGIIAPTGSLTVYRGAHVGGERGMSWTTDRDVAAWFARRFLMLADRFGPSYLLSAQIPATRVLGIFNGRGEREVVLNMARFPKSECHAIPATDPEVELVALGHRLPTDPEELKRITDRREELKATLRQPYWTMDK